MAFWSTSYFVLYALFKSWTVYIIDLIDFKRILLFLLRDAL